MNSAVSTTPQSTLERIHFPPMYDSSVTSTVLAGPVGRISTLRP